MLVDENDAHVFTLFGEPVKGGLDGRSVRLVVDNEEVLLGVCASRDVLQVIHVSFKLLQLGVPPSDSSLTPMPARSSPVTES